MAIRFMSPSLLAGILGSFLLSFTINVAGLQEPAVKATGSNITGDWIGTIDVGALKLRIIFHITTSPEGLKATIDSPDQNAAGLPVSSVKWDGSALTLESEKLNARYEGKRSSDLSTLEGTWKQGVLEQPLVMKRVKDKARLSPRSRPQNPKRPYPYREEDVFYDNKVQGNKLAATLTIPQGKGPFPTVVLITGSGPQDRDESLMGHKPFLVLADYLTRKGIAVLRADDRGVGKSTGEFSGATTADFATDTEAGIAYLKTRPEIAKIIGLIGHSEGGLIAPMVAARNRDVAFIVMLAGSGVPGEEIIVTQAELLTEAAGKSHEEALQAGAKQRKILEIVKENTTDDTLLEKQLREELAGEMSEAQVGAVIRQLNLRWLRYFLTYDPTVALRKVTCPVLALNGEKDMQVPPKQNLPPIRKALEAAGNKNFEVDELPGLNHLFQTAKTGAPSEYSEIEETLSPVVLEKIADWILKVTRTPVSCQIK